MNQQTTVEQMHQLKVHGMAKLYQSISEQPAYSTQTEPVIPAKMIDSFKNATIIPPIRAIYNTIIFTKYAKYKYLKFNQFVLIFLMSNNSSSEFYKNTTLPYL